MDWIDQSFMDIFGNRKGKAQVMLMPEIPHAPGPVVDDVEHLVKAVSGQRRSHPA